MSEVASMCSAEERYGLLNGIAEKLFDYPMVSRALRLAAAKADDRQSCIADADERIPCQKYDRLVCSRVHGITSPWIGHEPIADLERIPQA